MADRATAIRWLSSAGFWRECAQAMDDRPTTRGLTRASVMRTIPYTRAECLRRARLCVYLARRAGRGRAKTGRQQGDGEP